MYVTKPQSKYKKYPELYSASPSDNEGPNSGYLVIQDDEEAIMMPSCFGRSSKTKSLIIEELPLPSNNFIHFDFITVVVDDDDEILAIPVINQPLSSNRYYIIKARTKFKGEAYVCSKEEDKRVSCGKSYIQDMKSRPLDPEDIYQQFEIDYATEVRCTKTNNGFVVKSIVPGGHVPRFLRNLSPMQIQRSTSNSKDIIILEEANGLNTSLRKDLPSFDFNLSRAASQPVCVGKWYCPFMFIQEGKWKDQMKNSTYYEMTLEQRWERIFTTENSYNQLGNKVMMDVVVALQDVAVGGVEAVVVDETNLDNKVVWFRSIGSVGEQGKSGVVGLNKKIVERMLWEEERVGWRNGKERQVRVVREEEYGGIGWWVRFGCYVLVERFVLKRMDGSVVLTYDFRHIHQIKTKWE